MAKSLKSLFRAAIEIISLSASRFSNGNATPVFAVTCFTITTSTITYEIYCQRFVVRTRCRSHKHEIGMK